MRLFGSVLALAAVVAAQGSTQSPTTTSCAETSTNTNEPCALAREAWDKSEKGRIPAEIAYACLKSIPVAVEEDATLIDQLKLLWEWHSEVVYLKNPPASWELGPLDVMTELDEIKENLDSFESEYDVHLAIQELTIRTGNFHFNYLPDILSVFSFIRQAAVATVSEDGSSVPQTYLVDDLMVKHMDDNANISPIGAINEQHAQEYLHRVARHEQYIDHDAAYNSLMFKGYTDKDNSQAMGRFSVPSATAVYWGPSTNITFMNGTTHSYDNLASVYDMEGVTDAESFFDKFCTGKVTGINGTMASSTKKAPLTKRENIVPKYYPEPVVEHSAGAVAGYFMKDEGFTDIAVLKIITFAPEPDSNKMENEFQTVVKKFLHRCKEAGMKRLVIDLRENGGGSTQLLLDTFMQLFPTDIPWSIQRNRATDAFKRLGDAWNKVYNNDELNEKYQDAVGDNEPDLSYWYYDNYVDLSGETFQSWKQFYGPHEINGDQFTTPMRYNLSNSDRYSILYGNFNFTHPAAGTQAFKAEDMVMLTDGMCGSACASFHESLKNIAGVQAVTVGGRTENGPMQTVGASKGGTVIGFPVITSIAAGALGFAEPVGLEELQTPRMKQLAHPHVLLKRAGDGNSRIQIQDQLRKGDGSGTPLQYIREMSDCRLFYSTETLLKPEKLWEAAWTANVDRSRCVAGSTMQESSISGGYKPSGPGNLDGR